CVASRLGPYGSAPVELRRVIELEPHILDHLRAATGSQRGVKGLVCVEPLVELALSPGDHALADGQAVTRCDKLCLPCGVGSLDRAPQRSSLDLDPQLDDRLDLTRFQWAHAEPAVRFRHD